MPIFPVFERLSKRIESSRIASAIEIDYISTKWRGRKGREKGRME